MKKMTKLLLLLLTYAPITSVAVVAQAKVSELVSEDQNKLLISLAKTDTFSSHFDEQLSDGQIRDVRSLVDNDLVRVGDDPGGSGGGPSHYAI